MEPGTSKAIRHLDQKRLERGLSHERFARICLDISPGYWSLVRRGLRPFKGAPVTGALRTFPELAPVLVAALHDGAPTPPAVAVREIA